MLIFLTSRTKEGDEQDDVLVYFSRVTGKCVPFLGEDGNLILFSTIYVLTCKKEKKKSTSFETRIAW